MGNIYAVTIDNCEPYEDGYQYLESVWDTMDGAERHLKDDLGFVKNKRGEWVCYYDGDDIRHESMEAAEIDELKMNPPKYVDDIKNEEHVPKLSSLNRDERIAYGLSVLRDMYQDDEIDILVLHAPDSDIASYESRVLDDGVVTCIMYVPIVSSWDGKAVESTGHAIIVDSTKDAVSFCNDILDESSSFYGHRNDDLVRIPELTADIACTVARVRAGGNVTDTKCVGCLDTVDDMTNVFVINVTYDDGEHETYAVSKDTFECWLTGDRF